MTTTTERAGMPADTRAEARQVYRQSLAAEMPLTGRQLGEMFDRGDRWGRDRIAEVKADAMPTNGTPQVSTPELATLPVAVEADAETAKDQPRGARPVVWAAFLLGITASIAANIAHAEAGFGPRAAAAFAPLALLLAVECMSRPTWHRAGWAWGLARYGGTGLVATVAAVMSYRHMSGLLTTYGEDRLNAVIGPLAVDGLMVVAGFALLAMTPREKVTR